ncbi:Serine/threonine-protein phosphatase 6 regulatory subunit 2 [Liparis tanakae]|uniref:Serine/threonine-protein phosphatase 6 regulatory subunit 2 n=1 Tax=Liparis tanakae TaxID=230148 RepID=A0A4Z2F2L4_9TELE|nr:Serine/threonine-protein phosphatase 6 regulatory subunit 2 [Liparis tanakae]
MHSSSEDDDMESPFPNDLSLQQAFSDYQIQQMTANFVDQFGFNDEEFSEHDENINATFDRIAEINFNLDADDHSANAAAFEACCKERIRQFDDVEEEEDIWEEKEMNYATQAKSRTRFGVSQSSEESPRSSMENGGRERDHGSGSDEDQDCEQNPSEPGERTAAARPRGDPEHLGHSSLVLVSSAAPGPGPAAPAAPGPGPSGPGPAAPGPGPSGPSDPGPGPGWTAHFRASGGPAASQTPAGWDGAETQGSGWATFTEFQPFSSSGGGPRCSSPVESGSADADADGGQEASGERPSEGGGSEEDAARQRLAMFMLSGPLSPHQGLRPDRDPRGPEGT